MSANTLRGACALILTVLAPTVLTGGSPPPAEAGTGALVAAYSFDETSGEVAVDASGNGNHGAVSGASRTSAGRYGGGLSFDGVDDLVTVAHASSLALAQMTIEAWVRPRSTSGWRAVAMKERASGFDYSLYASSNDGRPRAYVSDRSVSADSPLPVDTWTHLTATYDGNLLNMYVNGILRASHTVVLTTPDSGGPLRIGGTEVWADEAFAGVIDEVRIYNRALAQAEIQADMASGIGSGEAPAPDTTAPAVSLTSPVGSASVAGTVSVSATAADEFGIAGVQFKLDGANLGIEDTSAPYAVNWDTTAVANGEHRLSAVARDEAGNSAIAAEVTVRVENAEAAPSNGLVAAFGFEEGVGSSTLDSSGRGNAGVISGAAWTSAGRFGRALSFDGSDDWVTVADAASLDLRIGMTVEAWVYPTSLPRWPTVVVKEASSGFSYALYGNSSSNNARGYAGAKDVRGRDRVAVNTWTHLATSYDGTTLRLYVNGALSNSRAVTLSMPDSVGPLRIGGNGRWPDEWFDGRIDEIRIYNRALSGSELRDNMSIPVVAAGASAPTPSADTQPPTTPASVAVSSRNGSSISLAWSPSTDNVAVSGYGLYRNGSRVGTATAANGTISGLTCGTSYTLGVDAVDGAGNRSSTTSIAASTTACGDTQAPTPPSNVSVSSRTTESISLSWSQSTDNVGVAGYGVYRAGSRVGTSPSPSFSVSGLSCGTTYTLGIDAYDTAGNRSNITSLSTSTAACPPSEPSTGASVFVAPNGSDANPCTQTQPCRGFDRAYRVAKPGQIVEVAGGSYPSQLIDVDSTKAGSTQHVVFRPAAGSKVSMSNGDNGLSGNTLSICASYIVFQGTTTRTDALAATATNPNGVRTGFDIFNVDLSLCRSPVRQPHHIELRNLSISKMSWTGSRDNKVVGGQIGPLTGCGPHNNEDMLTMKSRNAAYSGDGKNYPLTNVVLDGVVFHDLRKAGCANHMDMIQVYTGVGVTIRNSQFLRSSDQALFGRCELECSAAIPQSNWLIENNYFDTTTVTPNALALVSGGAVPCTNMIVRNNTMRGNAPQLRCTLGAGSSSSPAEIQAYGNVFFNRDSTCTLATYRHNVYWNAATSRCDTTEYIASVSGSLLFTDIASNDFRLRAGSQAIDRGDPSRYPALDHFGRTRPAGVSSDAGAHEAG